jgi:oxygen-independent coproporphyrinogen-3 oxidase
MIPKAPTDPLTGLSASRLGVYVHFPYCLSKCPYCDFASTVAKEIPEERYAKAIVSELKLRLEGFPQLAGRSLGSVFFGGGTPSLWNAAWVERVLGGITSHLPLTDGAEVTLEANPGAADAGRFESFRAAGINRLSIGVQSFQARTLAALGRAHDGDAAESAFRAARKAKFANVSMDFIYGVHGQQLDEVRRDAERAASLEPEHLSAYALTLEPEALAEEVPLARQLARGEVTLPSEDETLAMGHAVGEIYAAHGLARYETSNYARPGFHSRHNALYWTGGEYLALGAGATGFIRGGAGAVRYSNHRSAERYLAEVEARRAPEASRESIHSREQFIERVAMGLRLFTGIDLDATCSAFGESFSSRRPAIDRLIQDGFARMLGSRLALTDAGADLHSSICASLI